MAVNEPERITVRIERLVLETEHPVDGFALQQELGAAIDAVLVERGIPEGWRHQRTVPSLVVDGVAWDGRAGEAGLARAVAEALYVASSAPAGSRSGSASWMPGAGP